VREELDTEVKYNKAQEDTAWGFAAKDYTQQQLEMACAWVDTTKPAGDRTKSDAKLPHHLPGDGKMHGGTLVWHGVSAAMAALLGARGGTAIPSGDRQKVYNHLRTHYAEFGKNPPDLKSTGGVEKDMGDEVQDEPAEVVETEPVVEEPVPAEVVEKADGSEEAVGSELDEAVKALTDLPELDIDLKAISKEEKDEIVTIVKAYLAEFTKKILAGDYKVMGAKPELTEETVKSWINDMKTAVLEEASVLITKLELDKTKSAVEDVRKSVGELDTKIESSVVPIDERLKKLESIPVALTKKHMKKPVDTNETDYVHRRGETYVDPF